MSKFVKAYCGTCEQYFGMKVDSNGSAMEVVDFYDIDPEKAKLLASDTNPNNLTAAGNLLPCFVCGTRKIGGCSCAKGKYTCKKNMGYHYQCLYCKDLTLFAEGEGSEADANLVGKKVTLAQGQVVEICGSGSKALQQIRVGVGWEPSNTKENMDVDSSVVVLSADNMSAQLVYYGDKKHPSGCVVHRGDNLYGGQMAGNQGNDSENIDVFLQKVPPICDKLIFILNIYKCDEKHQNFGMVKNLYIELVDALTEKKLVEYHVSENLKNMTGLVIGAAYKKNEKWYFAAIGEGLQVSDLKRLAEHCCNKYQHF